MKYYLYLFLLLILSSAASAESLAIKDERLQINVTGVGKNPKSWLRHREDDKQNSNLLNIRFNIENVRNILITDLNAVDNKCHKDSVQYPFFLELEPNNNIHQIKTRIGYPCLSDRTAKLKLSITTHDDKRYYNEFNFPVDAYTVTK